MHAFGWLPDGDTPWASFIEVGRALYSTTQGGGNGYGTVFKLTRSGRESIVYAFESCCGDGDEPIAPLLYTDGTLYGTSAFGGSNNDGAVFAVTLKGTEHVVYSFSGTPDGASPGLGGLVLLDGAFYGTTESGGANNDGTVFKIAPPGVESVVYSFKGAPDGAVPTQALLAVGGKLYGTTSKGGAGSGTVFRVSTSGKEQVLYRFLGEPDGATPQSQLIDVHGVFYGTTGGGGASDLGTIFRINP